MLRALREGATSGDASVPRRVRVELPLPADRDTDDLVYLGLHGQAADWSGGMQQRFRVTKGYVEDAMLDGYDHEYLGLLDRDADGMGVWRVGENMTAVAHPSDVTVGFFLRLLRGEYGDARPRPVPRRRRRQRVLVRKRRARGSTLGVRAQARGAGGARARRRLG